MFLGHLVTLVAQDLLALWETLEQLVQQEKLVQQELLDHQEILDPLGPLGHKVTPVIQDQQVTRVMKVTLGQ